MAIYYSLTFFLLAAEMAAFIFVLMPMPLAARKKLFHFLTESYIVGKIAYGLKISFIFVAILFVDAVQRMLRITAEAEASKNANSGVNNVSAEVNVAARKFYAQRNTYLTGFCLFLSLCMTRTIQILVHLVHTEEELNKLRAKTASGSSDAIAEVEELKAELQRKERDLGQQSVEYDRVAAELQRAMGSGNKRVD
ncbi:hypothetical protein CPB86DRAFT_806006 [Serendipita vermifera]|nr:hypothetical protein CPB86DRAFT_806006 [Serendipita vermifera]